MKKLLLLSLIFTGPLASAQTVTNAEVVIARPAVGRYEAGIKSCGVNFLVGFTLGGEKALLYDFSANVWSTADGMIKAGSQYVSYSKSKGWDFSGMEARDPGPDLFWFAKRDDSISIRPPKYIEAENKGFKLAASPPAETMRLVMAASRGDPMQVSMQYYADRIHRVVAFRSTMSQDDQDTVNECFGALIKRMNKENPPS